MKHYKCPNCDKNYTEAPYYYNGMFIQCENCNEQFKIKILDIGSMGIETDVNTLHDLIEIQFIEVKLLVLKELNVRIDKKWIDNYVMSYQFLALDSDEKVPMEKFIQLINETEVVQKKLYNLAMAHLR